MQSKKTKHKVDRKHDPQTSKRTSTKDTADSTPSLSHSLELLDRLPASSNTTLRRQAMQDVSRMLGNQALIQRGIFDSIFGGSPTTADPEEAALEEFRKKGTMPTKDGKDIIGAGGRGGFNAKYDPDNQELIATINIGINFHHGLNIDETTGVVTANAGGLVAGDTSELATLQTSAANVMTDFPDLADRISEVKTNWRWTSSEEVPWIEDYDRIVTDAWDDQHYFQSKRWSQLFSNVRVIVNVHKGDMDGDHCSARIIKTPPGTLGAYVSRGSTTDAQDQGMLLSSSGIGRNQTNFLQYSLQFENNSADLNKAVGTVHSTDTGPNYLNKFIADFQAGYPDAGVPIQITGRASSTGDEAYNQALSEKRAKAVEDYLKANGLTGSVDRVAHTSEGEDDATEDAEWRRVDIIVGSGEAQNTAAHEFGHIIGLGDEYASPATGFYPGAGTPVPVGNPAAHDALAQAMGGGVRGAVAENSDSIMSVGNTVRPQHYATFHKALEDVTGESWEYGGASTGIVLPAVGGPEPDTMIA